jgi:N-acetylmuramoyl-L-alanine amidase
MKIVSLLHRLACRKRTKPITTIVLHATAGGTAQGAIATLKARGLSYHAIVEDGREQDGEINKCVPDGRVAYHAGKSVGPNGPNVNDYSLGASLVNLNDGKDPYSAKQVEAMLERCASWLRAYPTIKYITTHYWISPGRKSDPRNAPGFDIHEFHRELVKRAGPIRLWEGP